MADTGDEPILVGDEALQAALRCAQLREVEQGDSYPGEVEGAVDTGYPPSKPALKWLIQEVDPHGQAELVRWKRSHLLETPATA